MSGTGGFPRTGAPGDGPATDPVTGALPRSVMLDRLQAAVRAAEESGTSLSVCLFDLDYFKSINDAYGHARGDAALRQVVKRTHALVRAEDELFRYGGDEFVLLLPRCSPSTARELATRVVDGVRRAPFGGAPTLSLSVSMGVASYPDDGRTVEDLLRTADRRSFTAKREGRARLVAADAPAPGEPAHATGDTTGDTTANAPALQPVARLVEREAALAQVHEAFAAVTESGGAAVLDLAGPPGSGRTRMLEEIAVVARLRGFPVVRVDSADDVEDAFAHLPAASEPLPEGLGGRPALCVTVDGTLDVDSAGELIRGARQRGAGLVLARISGGDDERTLRALGAAHRQVVLEPWSDVGLRVWLRGVLRSEPADALVDRVLQTSTGLPGRAHAELERLLEAGVLVPDPGGGWRPAEAWGDHATVLGREREITNLLALLHRRRLVTIVGPGGVGKTTLARAVAEAAAPLYAGGGRFVALESARDRDGVEAGLAGALDVTPAPGQSLLEGIVEALRRAPGLLVLDNLEQVLTAAPLVSELLDAVPGLLVVATSRERLRLYGEQVFALEPLALPDADGLPFGGARLVAAAAASPAVRLFCARASEAAWDFTLTEGNARAVVDLCRRLDGLPLAIELAAARCGSHTPAEVLATLGRAVDDLLDGPRDRAHRQQTLRATIDWSVDLLPEPQRTFFARLAVFPAAFTADAATEVCGDGLPADQRDTALAGLVERSLVRRDGDRYSMLQVLREYAAELLEKGGESSATRERHARRYLEPARALAALMRSAEPDDVLVEADLEYPNLRAALEHAVDSRDAALAAELAVALWWYWSCRGLLDEGRGWLDAVLELPLAVDPKDRGDLGATLRARLQNAAGVLATMQADLASAGRHLEESLELARGLDDTGLTAAALSNLAHVHDNAGEFERALPLYQEGLELRRAAGDPVGIAASQGNLGACYKRMGRLEAAREMLEESARGNRARRASVNLTIALADLGEVLVLQGDGAAARAALDEAHLIASRLDDQDLIAQTQHGMGMLAALDGDVDQAAARFRAALAGRLALREHDYAALTLEELALLSVESRRDDAVRLYACAAALRRTAAVPQSPVYRDRHEPVLESLRRAVGERFGSLWAEGAATPPDTFVAPGA